MPSEPKEGSVPGGAVGGGVVTRPLRSALLQKQPEIEEVEEEDTSPGSDQSDTTITAGTCSTIQIEKITDRFTKQSVISLLLF